MKEIGVPGYRAFCLRHLVLDYNGTLALDGEVIEGVTERLEAVSRFLQIHIVTANTFGRVRERFSRTAYTVHVLAGGNEDKGKLAYVEQLGTDETVCIGNGRNDRLMLENAALGIAVMQEEGVAAEALRSADIFVPDIVSALGLLVNPRRLVATLRS